MDKTPIHMPEATLSDGKATLYKTAWSHLFNTYVGITHAHKVGQDTNHPHWVFTCTLVINGVKVDGFLFSERELSDFCL